MSRRGSKRDSPAVIELKVVGMGQHGENCFKMRLEAKDILGTEIHQQGGRKIIVQEISPIDLPPLAVASSPPMAKLPAS